MAWTAQYCSFYLSAFVTSYHLSYSSRKIPSFQTRPYGVRKSSGLTYEQPESICIFNQKSLLSLNQLLSTVVITMIRLPRTIFFFFFPSVITLDVEHGVRELFVFRIFEMVRSSRAYVDAALNPGIHQGEEGAVAPLEFGLPSSC